jgi:pyruvate kinase
MNVSVADLDSPLIKDAKSLQVSPEKMKAIIPHIQKDKVMVCRVEVDGEIKENKPLYFPGLDWYKDLKLSVLGPKDVKVLHNSIQ